MRILSSSAKLSPGRPILLATTATTYITYRLGAVASLKFLAIENMLPHFSAHVFTIWRTLAYERLRSVREFGAPQHISKGLASCLRYCSDVVPWRPTELCTMFGRLPGWYTIYTLSGALIGIAMNPFGFPFLFKISP